MMSTLVGEHDLRAERRVCATPDHPTASGVGLPDEPVSDDAAFYAVSKAVTHSSDGQRSLIAIRTDMREGDPDFQLCDSILQHGRGIAEARSIRFDGIDRVPRR